MQANLEFDIYYEGKYKIILLNEDDMEFFEKTIELSKEKNTASINFTINNPRLWWVRNIGEPY